MGWINRVMIATMVVGTVVVGTAVFVVKRLNEPPKVPSGFVAPTTRATPPPAGSAQTPRSTQATVPQAVGPVLAAGDIVFASDRTGNFEVWAMRADGSRPRQLTNDPATDAWWPRPSPDRRTILFNRTPAGVHDRDYGAVSLWSMGADGSGSQLLRPPGLDGWSQQGHAEWSPDGSHMVMFGGSKINPQIYVTDSVGQNPAKITSRGGTNLDPSYSPDGSTVVFVGCPRSFCQADDYEIYTVAATGGAVTRITDNSLRDHDPYYSPDGSQLAWLTQVSGANAKDPIGVWDVTVAAADGSGAHLLTGDSNVTSRPIWSSDGSTVLVHRLEKGTDSAFQLFRIDVRSGKVTRLTSGRSTNEYPG